MPGWIGLFIVIVPVWLCTSALNRWIGTGSPLPTVCGGSGENRGGRAWVTAAAACVEQAQPM
ncbi:hypothetical protein C1T30_43530, partial [Bacillus sp. MBGLi97]